MKKETLEEAKKYAELSYYGHEIDAFVRGAKWQQEQDKKLYSEEEVLNFTQTILMQYKFGNTNIEQLDLLKETLEQFKNK
jgi:hypothetical protein